MSHQRSCGVVCQLRCSVLRVVLCLELHMCFVNALLSFITVKHLQRFRYIYFPKYHIYSLYTDIDFNPRQFFFILHKFLINQNILSVKHIVYHLFYYISEPSL